MENLFFNIKDLKKLGKNSIIGKTVRIRYPELVSIGDNCIIDDFTYISTQLTLENYSHISSGCKFIGGKKSSVSMGMLSTTAPNVVLAAGNDDYVSGIGSPLIPNQFKGNTVHGKINLNELTIIGSNSVILPNVNVGVGSTLGALSLANQDLESWYVYAGIPAKKIKNREKNQILKLKAEFLSQNT
jgi:galactoside O-acetyltransferase